MENKIMPKTNKVVVIDEVLSVEQTTLKRGKAVQELQTKNDIASKLMSFFKIKVDESSPAMVAFVTDVNQACENFASALEADYDVEVFDTLSGSGFFTEVIEGMKEHCKVALDKVQSDARRKVLIDSGEVPAELWEASKEATTSTGVSQDVQALIGGLKK
jgi:hypothetical protein